MQYSCPMARPQTRDAVAAGNEVAKGLCGR